MRLALHIRYLILFLVPALAVPRGVLLELCVCLDAEMECCTQCCGERSDDEAPDCDGCKSIEVDDFQEAPCPAPVEVPAPVLASAPPIVVIAVVSRVPGMRCEGRAPPDGLTPPGLRAGTAPLRL